MFTNNDLINAIATIYNLANSCSTDKPLFALLQAHLEALLDEQTNRAEYRVETQVGTPVTSAKNESFNYKVDPGATYRPGTSFGTIGDPKYPTLNQPHGRIQAGSFDSESKQSVNADLNRDR